MDTKQIEFNLNEANASIQLYDMAVKSGGLNVAEAALVLTKKLQQAFNIKPEETKSEEVKEETKKK